MKTLIAVGTALVVLVGSYVVLGNLYAQQMYDAAIGMEADLSGLTEKQVSISIGDISYYENQQSTDKPSIVLVHGFGAYKENWLRFARVFKDDFHVVVIDLPGHGKSVQNPALIYSTNNQVAWVHEFVQAISLTKFHMAGNSMGGAITAQYSAQFPEQVLTATLIDPAGVTRYRSVMQDLIDAGNNPLVVESHADFLALMDFALEQSPFIPWPLTEVSAKRAHELKPLHDKLWLDMQVGHGEVFEAMLSTIQTPTLVMWGEQDRVINYQNMAVFEKLIPNATSELWPGVGHAPMVEIPKASAQRMLSHITATQLASSL